MTSFGIPLLMLTTNFPTGFISTQLLVQKWYTVIIVSYRKTMRKIIANDISVLTLVVDDDERT